MKPGIKLITKLIFQVRGSSAKKQQIIAWGMSHVLVSRKVMKGPTCSVMTMQMIVIRWLKHTCGRACVWTRSKHRSQIPCNARGTYYSQPYSQEHRVVNDRVAEAHPWARVWTQSTLVRSLG